ncbi:MAG: hypothetical protein QNJ11_18075 [Woeseiaceae bacterium]|nr:hypothetical protein [Woeseiaceae bacterium]
MTITTLWLPILAGTFVTFVAGAVIWMAMPWHKTDFSPTADEKSVRSALKGLAPGQYSVPFAVSRNDMASREMISKFREGPVGFITIVPSGEPAMGGKLLLNFVYNLIVAVIAAYMVSRTLSSGADYLAVFRIAGTVGFVAYGMAYLQESIWFGRPWPTTVKSLVDALIYGLLLGGVFGWLT